MKSQELLATISRVLLSPWTSLCTMGAGVALGVFDKELALSLHPFGQSYLSLLSMCVYPVLVTAIATSIAGLVRSGHGGRRVEIMALALVGFILTASLFGVLGGVLGRPGDSVGEEAKAQMAGVVDKAPSSSSLEINFFAPDDGEEKAFGVGRFLKEAISPNIFESLSMNHSLQVLFFSILLGVALGALKADIAKPGIATLESFYHAFIVIIKWAMYPLSFGLFCLVASEVAKVGADIVVSMAGFLAVFHIAGGLFIILCAIAIWRKSGLGFWKSISAMKDPIIISVGARNSLAALPSAIEAMTQELHFKEEGPRLLLPLAITVGRFGNVLYFSLAGVFVAQLYGAPLGFPELAMILFCGAFAGMATSGATGAVTLTMMMMVLEPMRLPWEAVLALFIAIDSIADPLRTLLIVYPGCALTALIAEKEGDAPAAASEAAQPSSGIIDARANNIQA